MRDTKLYVTTADAAELLGVSERRVRQLAAAGRIDGAERFGRSWAVPLGPFGRPVILSPSEVS